MCWQRVSDLSRMLWKRYCVRFGDGDQDFSDSSHLLIHYEKTKDAQKVSGTDMCYSREWADLNAHYIITPPLLAGSPGTCQDWDNYHPVTSSPAYDSSPIWNFHPALACPHIDYGFTSRAAIQCALCLDIPSFLSLGLSSHSRMETLLPNCPLNSATVDNSIYRVSGIPVCIFWLIRRAQELELFLSVQGQGLTEQAVFPPPFKSGNCKSLDLQALLFGLLPHGVTVEHRSCIVLAYSTQQFPVLSLAPHKVSWAPQRTQCQE